MSEVCVRVAVRIRPLLPREVLHNHQVCVRAVPGSADVMLGSDRVFSFDHAFGPTASQDEVYASCVRPLVEALVDGYNATVFCYGQTGSGKTFTLGGVTLDEDGGIIERVSQDVFSLLGEKRENNEARVRVSYMELYKEELRDLLELQTVHKELHIREDERGNTVVVGAREVAVASAEELLSVLQTGNALRRTAPTGMNEHSSRSHAILTLQLHRRHDDPSPRPARSPKLCLVDLAGSERAGKTGDAGARLKDSVHINTGLLALGNVIRALSDPARGRRGNGCSGAHVPYRDAKITRLLRDSLGGTAHTLMVACVSPSHHSVAETLNVLLFAAKARHVRNHPGAAAAQAEVKLCPTPWDPGKARLGELEYEAQTLRVLLKEKEKEIEVEREKAGERESVKVTESSHIKESGEAVTEEDVSQYHLLAQEAAALLARISGSSLSQALREQLEDWQGRLTAVNNSQQTNGNNKERDGERDRATILKLRRELSRCKEALAVEEQLLQQKNAQLTQVQKQVEMLVQENKTHLQALEEEKRRTQIQAEQLVDQQISMDRLRSELISAQSSSGGAMVESRASAGSGKRPHSVPLMGPSCGARSSRKIYSSPPTYSLERVMAAFKMRSHLLLAEIEEKDEVFCPFIKQQAEANDEDETKKDDEHAGTTGFRRSLNRTWTGRQKKTAVKGKNAPLDRTSNGNLSPIGAKDRKAKLGAIVTQRRIHDLSASMHMKEELIKQLSQTEREVRAVGRHASSSGDLLERLSVQSQQVRAEAYRSLQHMRLQRAQLQTSLQQQTVASHDTAELPQNGGQRAGDVALCKRSHQEESKKKLCDSWLETEEELVLQKRVELQELEEELRRREEVLLRREACLQQKDKLEIKRLRSSQALNQELLRVSMRLESVEEQLWSSSTSRLTITVEELEKERDLLGQKRDALDAQLKENRVLNVEEEHSLLQLDEAIEALDAALEFKNQCIQEKQRNLLITDSSPRPSQSTEPADLCDIVSKLKKLSLRETSELLLKYFNKVVCLREVERHLRLRCEELELHVGELEVVLKEMEASMQRLAVDVDRRLTQQHRDHQNHIQLLLQKLQGGTGEVQQAIQDKVQHLEKELFFYRSSSRQLKKKLKELLSGSLQPDLQRSHTQDTRQSHDTQIYGSADNSQTYTEEVQTSTHITPTYTKIHAKHPDQNNHSNMKQAHQLPCPSSSSELQVFRQTNMPEHKQTHIKSQSSEREAGRYGQSMEMTPVRLCRRDLRQISPRDLQISGSATRRRQSAVSTSTETILEDSIEVPRNTDR
ncbi:kinesin-like protein KIF27 isoform X2 [Betta splendens]|uniref:Kinesin-like protein KIF27 isoform X2 n=1 Tax=Betta splendens TaxID=158456 RepID=A0A6P7NFK0_BETSP|nr:kinesin-like protein KIF27 isoform X2 [Betta splendens]